MQVYTNIDEEFVFGIISEDPSYILEIMQELYGFEYMETDELRFEPYDEVGAIYQDTIVVKYGLVDEEFLSAMLNNNVYVLISP